MTQAVSWLFSAWISTTSNFYNSVEGGWRRCIGLAVDDKRGDNIRSHHFQCRISLLKQTWISASTSTLSAFLSIIKTHIQTLKLPNSGLGFLLSERLRGEQTYPDFEEACMEICMTWTLKVALYRFKHTKEALMESLTGRNAQEPGRVETGWEYSEFDFRTVPICLKSHSMYSTHTCLLYSAPSKSKYDHNRGLRVINLTENYLKH